MTQPIPIAPMHAQTRRAQVFADFAEPKNARHEIGFWIVGPGQGTTREVLNSRDAGASLPCGAGRLLSTPWTGPSPMVIISRPRTFLQLQILHLLREVMVDALLLDADIVLQAPQCPPEIHGVVAVAPAFML